MHAAQGQQRTRKARGKAAGLQQEIDELNAEKASFAEQIGELTSQIQQLQEDKKEAASRAQEELELKARELYEAHHATDKSNVCSFLAGWLVLSRPLRSCTIVLHALL